MKWVNMKWLAGVALVAGSMGLGSQALAAVTLTTDPGDPYYLGLINDGIPSSPAREVIYINNLLTLPLSSGPTPIGSETYTRSGNLCGGNPCTAAIETGAPPKDESGNNEADATGFTYLLGKYDAAKAGSLVWYVAGLTDVVIPEKLNGLGLSHISLYNTDGKTPPSQIPEPASLALVGLGLAGLALTRRRRQR